jgi:hypothetical protein
MITGVYFGPPPYAVTEYPVNSMGFTHKSPTAYDGRAQKRYRDKEALTLSSAARGAHGSLCSPFARTETPPLVVSRGAHSSLCPTFGRQTPSL